MHRVTLQPSGLQFDVEAGESVLAAALRQGYVLPYGCKNGACGSCKGKLLEGALDYGIYQKKALPDEEKAAGKALFCQARPLSDVVIEARAIGAAKDIQIKTLPCRVQKLERLADDVMAIFLKLPANERLHFLAGQFIEFLLKGGARRSFSMANPPDADLLELHVRHVAGGQFTDHVPHRERVSQGSDAADGALLGRPQAKGPVPERAAAQVGRRARAAVQVRSGDFG